MTRTRQQRAKAHNLERARRLAIELYGPDNGELVYLHSLRFRRVSTRYPHMVTMAYDRDLARAADDTDEQVAATVADWERNQGLEPRDWPAIGADERDDDLDDQEDD